MATEVRKSGPMFRAGYPDAVIARGCLEAELQVAAVGGELVRAATVVFRHPTGRYRSSVRVEHLGGDALIHDGGIVYGPWLNGTAPRNRGSRFKGYGIWPAVRAWLDGDAVPIADHTFGRVVKELGG